MTPTGLPHDSGFVWPDNTPPDLLDGLNLIVSRMRDDTKPIENAERKFTIGDMKRDALSLANNAASLLKQLCEFDKNYPADSIEESHSKKALAKVVERRSGVERETLTEWEAILVKVGFRSGELQFPLLGLWARMVEIRAMPATGRRQAWRKRDCVGRIITLFEKHHKPIKSGETSLLVEVCERAFQYIELGEGGGRDLVRTLIKGEK